MLRVATDQGRRAADHRRSGGLAPTITTGDRGAISDIDYAAEMLDNGAAQWFDAFGTTPTATTSRRKPGQATTLTFRRVELIRAV